MQMKNHTKTEAEEFLLRVHAMLRLGMLCGITVSVTTAEGVTFGMHSVADGVSKLILLGDQIRMLDNE